MIEDLQTQRQKYSARLSQLRTMRSSFDSHWRSLAQNVAPRRSRFFTAEATTPGVKKEQHIINGTPVWALRTLAAGLMAGITSPARLWFRLTTPDPDLAEVTSVKQWLHQATTALHDAYAHSNFYNALHTLYQDLPLFGTGVDIMEADPVSLMRLYSIPVGEYFLAQSERGVVDTLYRVTELSVGQMAGRFGIAKCSRRVRDLYNERKFDPLIDVVHVIEPRQEYDPGKTDPENMPFASCWFESSTDPDVLFLKQGGYEENPILAPRWNVTGNDVYGSSPAMEVLGDCKSLQLYEKHKARAIEMIVDPPLSGPSTMRNRAVSLLPGARNWGVDNKAMGATVVVPPEAVTVTDNAIRAHEARIKSGLYSDLFLMLANDERSTPPTAEEVRELAQEKMLQLGPVMERLEDELLNPAVTRGLGILARAGKLPPAPPELAKRPDLRVQYSSVMSQAQKSLNAGGIQRLSVYVGSVVGAAPQIADKIDFDVAVSEMADSLDVPPTLIVPDEKVAQIRQQRAKAVQQQQQQQQALAAAQGAETLSKANTSGDNGLTRMLGGVAGAQAGGP